MIYATLPGPRLHSRLKRWTPALVFTLMSCVLASHQVSLSKLAQGLSDHPDVNRLEHLESTVLGLEQAVLQVQQTARHVPNRNDLEDLQVDLNKRLVDLENTLATHTAQQDLQPLLQRLERLESSQKSITQTPTPTPTPKQAKPSIQKPKKGAEPSFQILGLELRGAVQFLSVAPVGVQALDQSQLLRIGDTYLGWRLEHLDEQTAVFSVDGITHKLNVR
ncbi:MULTISPECIES: hypothetical protein [unclassified Pseudomonas]|uniref:hypothetical protein n=1 Tax=unclassified Pseudomonas TaxID=196821 RepID=UPI000876079D|nr:MULTISPECIES: hypothetical protein [unclassified Pseudomonas]SCZ40035.1 hypothetical protein SAMN03159405_04295 [Pseudomonas sp. NFACC44-2]SDA89883.1 hypothetical protein SAMN03159429_05690 [Pseudomonas sp. NFACC51]SFI17642.1 hypothetical protein SAMN03159302_03595 [Pseudomonas sp. NFACC54]SFT28478.1 hypothetical protein SAMN03159306_05447 [Pseudomonas sp. NFACC48-1]